MIKWLSIFCIALLIAGCRKVFNPPGALTDTSKYLVIDGIINTGSDSTIIKLSRTKKFDTVIVIDHEKGAQVSVESDANNTYPLAEITPGTYSAAPLNLSSSHQYRLRVKTTDGKTYLSDFVTVKNAPPIDSVGFTAKGNGVQVYVNTHDATNNTHYYRWEYAEAWRFHSTYLSSWAGYARRDASNQIYYCFTNDASNDITLSSSTQLNQDVIYQAPVAFIPSASEKIEIKYSILVKQYALTSDAYGFWQNLHKNNETRGSIFDAQPSDNQTNYHCITNPGELVVGYLSAGSTSSKRIFITREQLPSNYNPRYPRACQVDTVYYFHPVAGQPDFSDNTTFTAIEGLFFAPFPPQGVPSALTYSTTDCVDCTIRGVKTAPPFWK
jgi:hypothetical protein